LALNSAGPTAALLKFADAAAICQAEFSVFIPSLSLLMTTGWKPVRGVATESRLKYVAHALLRNANWFWWGGSPDPRRTPGPAPLDSTAPEEADEGVGLFS
jgi:hypothetical protein